MLSIFYANGWGYPYIGYWNGGIGQPGIIINGGKFGGGIYYY